MVRTGTSKSDLPADADNGDADEKEDKTGCDRGLPRMRVPVEIASAEFVLLADAEGDNADAACVPLGAAAICGALGGFESMSAECDSAGEGAVAGVATCVGAAETVRPAVNAEVDAAVNAARDSKVGEFGGASVGNADAGGAKGGEGSSPEAGGDEAGLQGLRISDSRSLGVTGGELILGLMQACR